MAVSRAERRWSKEPRMETTSSVMVWLLSRDALIAKAFSLSKSPPATAITILSSSLFFFFFFWILIWFFAFAKQLKWKTTSPRKTAVNSFTQFVSFGLSVPFQFSRLLSFDTSFYTNERKIRKKKEIVIWVLYIFFSNVLLGLKWTKLWVIK